MSGTCRRGLLGVRGCFHGVGPAHVPLTLFFQVERMGWGRIILIWEGPSPGVKGWVSWCRFVALGDGFFLHCSCLICEGKAVRRLLHFMNNHGGRGKGGREGGQRVLAGAVSLCRVSRLSFPRFAMKELCCADWSGVPSHIRPPRVGQGSSPCRVRQETLV